MVWAMILRQEQNILNAEGGMAQDFSVIPV